MRRWLALIGALGLIAGSAGGSLAAGATKTTDVVRDASCGPIPSPLGDVYFGAFISSLNGTDAGLDVIDPSTGVPVMTRDFDRPVSVTISSTAMNATIPLLPSGEATISATRSPADPFSFDEQFRSGNQWNRATGTGLAYALSGSLTLPGLSSPVSFGPEICSSSDATYTNFTTNPHAHVQSFAGTGGTCHLTNGQGDTLDMFISLSDGDLFMDATVTDAAGGVVGAVGDALVGSDGIATLTLSEYDPTTGNPTGGTASASASLTDTGETFAYVTRYSNQVYRTSGSTIDVEGSFAGSLGSFDLGPCVVAATKTKTIANNSNGPKPGGKTPTNDLPTGALTLKAGVRATAATKGAALASEAPFDCLTFPDGEGGTFTVPVNNTVWYKVTGTGSTVTVDTAGSDYDTVVAVYTGTPGSLTSIACVDDTRGAFDQNTQAVVSFPTQAGVTYWVQIGGLDEVDFLTGVRSVPYGTLKVAVR
jgi:hypothetical protein